MADIRVGIVGAGYIGGRHAQALAGIEGVRVALVADPQRDRAEALAAKAGAAVAESAEAVVAGDVDAVWLCVPPDGHGALELAALDRGLPFFVEKPLAADLATAERIAAAVERAGVPVATGYHWRWLDTVERARELLADRPPRLLLGAWLDKAPRTPWWAVRARSGGQTVEQVTHLLDLGRLFAGEATALHAAGGRSGAGPGDIQDAAAAVVRYASGAVGSFASTCLLGGAHRIGIELLAPGLAVTLTERDMTVDDGSGPVRHEVRADPFAREDAAFAAAVRGEGGEIRAPYAEALRTHALALQVAEAAG